MLPQILLLIAAVIVVFVVIVSLRPASFRIERRATIAAPAAVAFAQDNDFYLWNAWSPWAKIDPAMQQTFTRATDGKGSVYWWKGNNKVGEDRMTILEDRPAELVRIHLEFIAPFRATNLTEFPLKPAGSQTEVVWAMSGTNNFLLKAVTLFMNMDKTVGGDFERGLSQLKAVAEGATRR
jgi:hypothetical protein